LSPSSHAIKEARAARWRRGLQARHDSDDEAAAIRAAFDQGGAFAAAVELRRHFPGISDNVQARACALAIMGWKPLPPRPPVRLRKRSGKD
jgi:hypothetical protein